MLKLNISKKYIKELAKKQGQEVDAALRMSLIK